MAQSRINQFLDKIAAQLRASVKGELPTQAVFTEELKRIFQQLKAPQLRDALLSNFEHYASILWEKYSSSQPTAVEVTDIDPALLFTPAAFDSFLKLPRTAKEYLSVLAAPGCPVSVRESFVDKFVWPGGTDPETAYRSLLLARPFGTSQDPYKLTKEMELLAAYHSRVPPRSAMVPLLGSQLARFHLIHSSWPTGAPKKAEAEYNRRMAVLLAECLRCGCADSDFRHRVSMFGEQARSLLQTGSDPGGMLELISIVSSSAAATTIFSFSSSSSSSCSSSSSSSLPSSSLASLHPLSLAPSSSFAPSIASTVQSAVVGNLLSGLEELIANFEPRHCFRLALVASEPAHDVKHCFDDLANTLKLTDLPKGALLVLTRIGQNEKYFADLFAVSATMLKLALAQSVEEEELPVEDVGATGPLAEEQFFVDTAGDEHVRGIFTKKQRLNASAPQLTMSDEI